MDPFAILEHLRADYPKMSAVALIGAGAVLGWGAAWLLLSQQITTYKTRLEHAQEVIAGRIPAATYKPIRFGKGRSMVAGLILLVTGLILAVGGTALIFLSLDEKPTTAQLRGAPVSPAQIAPPSSSPQAAAAPEPRRFTNKTARELLALYDGRTPFQAEPLIAPHKGLWIRVNGQVLNVLPDGRPNHAVVILKDGDRIVECRVGPQGHSRSSKLNKDDSVVIQGRISDIQNGSQLYLLDCEFVDST